MAPTKKKKKTAAKSSRGVATTSIASKHAEVENEGEPKLAESVESPEEPHEKAETSRQRSSISGEVLQNDAAKSMHELNPQELEAHLDDSELQTILELGRGKVEQTCSRQVARLQTEKRLLRHQSEILSTWQALPPELRDEVFQMVLPKSGVSKARSQLQDRLTYDPEDVDDLLHSIWPIYKTLLGVGFSQDKVEKSLETFVQHVTSSKRPSETLRRDFHNDLQTCLDFIAFDLANEPHEEYHSASKARNPGVSSESDHSDSINNIDRGQLTSGPQNFDGVRERTFVADEHAHDASTDAIQETENGKSIDNLSDLESDMEPDQMIEKYVSLMLLLYQTDPNSAQFRNKTGQRATKKLGSSINGQTQNPIALKIRQQIDTLSSDILFDHSTAEALWGRRYIQLMQETSTRKRLGISEKNETLIGADPAQSKSQGCSQEQNKVSPDDVEDESAMMLGGMFESLPDTESPIIQVSEGEATSISLRTFGQWNGMSPKRVLEEAIKARDTSAKLDVDVIAETGLSCRHRVLVSWSKDPGRRFVEPFVEIDSSHTERKTRIEMARIACPDKVQSEAYVSTVALFQIFSQSPKEEKCYLRLPSVWRDFWAEAAEIQKEKDDAHGREILRSLRHLIERSTMDQASSYGDPTYVSHDSNANSANEPILPGPQHESFTDALIEAWTVKSSSAAYKSMLRLREQLPINQFKEAILSAIAGNQVVIVCGATGCGKSTQVPSYILETELAHGRHCKVYCTEPRRISAISLARRVSEELGERRNDVGTSRSLVGFAVRLDSRITSVTRLVYATTGIVMRMLESSPNLDDITHLLLDEVHERSIESDFLLIILRKLLIKRPSLKVVLMSATVDANKFSAYLGQAPIFEVPGRTYPVEVRYLEDVIEQTQYRLTDRAQNLKDDEDADDEVDHESGTTTPAEPSADYTRYSAQTRSTMTKLNEYRIEYDLIIKLLENLQSSDFADYNKATLVFLPGIAEIRRLSNMLSSHHAFAGKCEVFALHSSIATEDQERAFLPPAREKRKIVLATNIAETGITIPDITCVVDTGKHKEMRYDERRQLSRLIAAFVSQANAVQRRGRAGRVQKGLCFHLFSKQRFDKMSPEQTPEMLRLSLQDLVLRVKICGLDSIEDTLAEALDPPSAKNIRRAIDALQDVEALNANQGLTLLGRQLAKLPLDVFLGKLIILGAIFGCLDAAITIAAIVSSKTPFTASMGSQDRAHQAMLNFKRSDSDLLTVYNAYCGWRKVCATPGSSEQQYCRKNFLSIQALGNIEDLKGQLTTSIVDAGFVALDVEESSKLRRVGYWHGRRSFVDIPTRFNMNNTNDMMINAIIAAAFYPKLLKREGKGWRNVATNQTISLHPTSVNKRSDSPPKWLSFYHIMASGSKFYNAHETSAVEDLALLLLCGEADFKMYAGVVVIDNNRAKFVIKDWRTMVVLKTLRKQIKKIVDQQVKIPGSGLNEEQRYYMNVFRRIFTRDKEVPISR